jgi:hypothetical protein
MAGLGGGEQARGEFRGVLNFVTGSGWPTRTAWYTDEQERKTRKRQRTKDACTPPLDPWAGVEAGKQRKLREKSEER